MNFDPQNPVIHLCTRGMEQEGLGSRDEAASLFMQAWDIAVTDF
jgi:hypothetical protein